jgi:cation:H+ antiporter
MSDIAFVGGQFVICSALIVMAGVRLSRYGDVIAEKTGVGGTWIGVVLLAAVTSLPELMTGVSAIVFFDVVDIAAGDAIGSCMFNLLILAMLDALHPTPISARIHQGHMLSAGFGILLLGVLAGALVLGAEVPAIGWVAWPSIAILALYVLAMRTIFSFERARLEAHADDVVDELKQHDMPVSRAIPLFAAMAVILVAAASLLPGIAAQFAEVTGIAQTVVGSLLVAASTSMPEVVVSVAAVRLGAVDMAAANLFGSNLFNMAVIAFDDVVYVGGPLPAAVAEVHALSAIGAMLMTAVAMIGLTVRARVKRYRLSWDAAANVLIYLVIVRLLIA